MSTVSVCIVTYNSASDIKDCLQAVLKQSFPITSIIVVDNASSDETCRIVHQFGEQVRLTANKVNNGFAGGQNQAMAQTDSDYVIVLNPDVTLHPDYVSEIVGYMDQRPEVGSATGQLVSAEQPDTMDSAGLAMRRNRQAYDLGAGEPAVAWQSEQEVFGVSGAAAVYRKTMMLDVSYDGQFFDEVFFAYKEDVDAAWRAQHFGWKAIYVPSAKAYHRRGWKKGGRRSIPLFVRRHSYQNRFFTLIKNEPAGWHWFWLLPLLLVSELAKLGYIAVLEPGLLRCWPFILRKFPHFLRKRRSILGRK
ncbi:glycosyltransferase family 2 protein [Paenibacillus abyssi]|nr:glycosyltransferase family 2 protein [Paenibacillus abyssi]